MNWSARRASDRPLMIQHIKELARRFSFACHVTAVDPRQASSSNVIIELSSAAGLGAIFQIDGATPTPDKFHVKWSFWRTNDQLPAWDVTTIVICDGFSELISHLTERMASVHQA